MAELAIINGYDIRDRKLADATAQTSVASSDYVMVETTDGNYNKILKSNFVEAVRGALGSILSNKDKGTSIESVACLGSSNQDFGSITTANLASVLGGSKYFKFKHYNYILEPNTTQTVISNARVYLGIIDEHTKNAAIDCFVCVNGHNAVSLTPEDFPWNVHGKDTSNYLNVYCDGPVLTLQNCDADTLNVNLAILYT